MLDLFAAAQQLQAFCEREKWQYCLIGGIALLRWGEPRETADVDMTLLTDFGNEEYFITTLLKNFEPRIEKAAAMALQTRVLLLKSAKGIGFDVALGALPFEVSAVERSSFFEYTEGITLRTCSAEDLVVMKCFAGRDQDWIDLRNVLIRNAALDWSYIDEHLNFLLEIKGDTTPLHRLHKLRRASGA